MQDESLPPAIGKSVLESPALSPKQKDFCKRLDELYALYELPVKPSDMFRGAMFAIREECRSNPDWLAQAAHSLREILYPFWSVHVKNVPDKKDDALKKYGAVSFEDADIQTIKEIYEKLNDLAHHRVAPRRIFSVFSEKDFEQLIDEFVSAMSKCLIRQVDVHQEIDAIVSAGPESTIAPINQGMPS